MLYELVFIENCPKTQAEPFKTWLRSKTICHNRASNCECLFSELSYNSVRSISVICRAENVHHILEAVEILREKLYRCIGLVDLGPLECVNMCKELYPKGQEFRNRIYVAESSRGMLVVKPCSAISAARYKLVEIPTTAKLKQLLAMC